MRFSEGLSVRGLEEYCPPEYETYQRKAVVYHLYYPELVLESIETVNEFDCSYDKIFTVSETLPKKYLELIRSSSNARIFICQNTGRDIYPFWLLVRQGILDQYGLVCKVHGKKSLHRADGDEWRRLSIAALCGNLSRVLYVEDLFLQNPLLQFLAPKSKALLKTMPSHWVGNLTWLREISARLGCEVGVDDVAGLPIMAGSFYWITAQGIGKFRTLPISLQDWHTNFLEGDRIDGKLEHLVERSLTLNENFDFIGSQAVQFISEDGSLTAVETHLDIDSTASRLERRNIVAKAVINPTNHFSQISNAPSLVGLYDIAYRDKRTIISGFIVDLSSPYLRFEVLLYVGDECLTKAVADRCFNFPKAPGLGGCDFAFEVEVEGEIPQQSIALYEYNSRYRLLANPGVSAAAFEASMILANQQFNTFGYPEAMRQMDTPYATYLQNIGAAKSVTASEFRRALHRTVGQNSQLLSGQTCHVFVINNPIAEIAVSRIIQHKNLSRENTLLILHRVKATSLLKKFKFLVSPLPDIERVQDRSEVLDVFSLVNDVLKKIKHPTFELYGHHYNALFTHGLAMHPRCVRVNLVEEGNLSSVPNWEAQHLTKTLQYTDTAALIAGETPSALTHSVSSNLLSSEFDLFAHTLLKRNFSKDVPDLSHVRQFFETQASRFTSEYSLVQFLSILLFKRYYLWSGKMLFGVDAYRVSRAFHGFRGTVNIEAPSTGEVNLVFEYKRKLNEPFALLVLPVLGRFSLLNAIDQKPGFVEVFEGLSKGKVLHYILHPADRMSLEKQSLAKDRFEKWALDLGLDIVDLSDELGDAPVTEVASVCFEYVMHYGSSLSLILNQYRAETEELLYERFQ